MTFLNFTPGHISKPFDSEFMKVLPTIVFSIMSGRSDGTAATMARIDSCAMKVESTYACWDMLQDT